MDLIASVPVHCFLRFIFYFALSVVKPMNGIKGFQQKEMLSFFMFIKSTHFKVNIIADTKILLNTLKKACIYTMNFSQQKHT